VWLYTARQVAKCSGVVTNIATVVGSQLNAAGAVIATVTDADPAVVKLAKSCNPCGGYDYNWGKCGDDHNDDRCGRDYDYCGSHRNGGCDWNKSWDFCGSFNKGGWGFHC
jgi:hypothetical protein